MSFLYSRLTADPLDPEALRIAALGVQGAYTHTVEGVTAGTGTLGQAAPFEVKWGPGPEDSFWVKLTPPDINIFNSGTESFLTLMSVIAGAAVQKPLPPLAGEVAFFAWDRQFASLPEFHATIAGILASGTGGDFQNLVIVGHSLGGVDALLWAESAKSTYGERLNTLAVTFGSPACMTPEAASSVTVPHIRVHGPDDVVSKLPPAIVPGIATGAVGILVGAAYYGHAGTGVVLENTGAIAAGNAPLPFTYLQFTPELLQLPSGISTVVTPHLLETYISRLGTASVSPIPRPTVAAGGLPGMYQCCIFFKHTPSGQGWSEMFYMDSKGAGGSTDIYNRLNVLAGLRARMLGGAPAMSQVIGTRVSDVAKRGDSDIQTRAYVGPTWDGPLGVSDPAPMSILVRVQHGTLYRRQYWVGGYPDGIVTHGAYVNTAIDPAFSAAFATYFNELCSETTFTTAAQMWVREKQTEVDITDITLNTVAPKIGQVIISTGAISHGLTAGNKVKISGVKWVKTGAPPLGFKDKAPRGNFTVDSNALTGTTFALKNTAYVGAYQSDGVVEKVLMRYKPFTFYKIIGARGRKRGRPIDLLPGRGQAA